MKIREATTDDSDLIRNLHLDAFGKEDGFAVSRLAIASYSRFFRDS
ncbi:MAG: hypothetical protein ACK5EU_08185 [Pseudanabaena sp.]|nr:hypothetical protein [Pseudanabaena sp. M090S1SP2A07QC]MCA6622891.1 hypothetical protein [Pseudanabaena sp. M165S2SP1A06QC]